MKLNRHGSVVFILLYIQIIFATLSERFARMSYIYTVMDNYNGHVVCDNQLISFSFIFGNY